MKVPTNVSDLQDFYMEFAARLPGWDSHQLTCCRLGSRTQAAMPSARLYGPHLSSLPRPVAKSRADPTSFSSHGQRGRRKPARSIL